MTEVPKFQVSFAEDKLPLVPEPSPRTHSQQSKSKQHANPLIFNKNLSFPLN